MIDAYHMIVVNILASTTLAIGLLIYKLRYPERKINFFYLLLLISLLPLISILRKGSYQSGDLSLHVKYAMQFFDNLSQGNLIPRWIGNHCASYGCPEFIFIFSLPYYIISLLHLIGLSFLFSAKILLIVTFLLSGIGMFLWMKDELDEKSGFVSALFYLFAPYHLIDLHFRVSIGELVSIAILPFLFLSTKWTIERHKVVNFFTTTALIVLLILAHQATVITATPFVFIYAAIVWFRNKNTLKPLLYLIMSYIFAGLITCFYWLPLLLESKYIFYGHIGTIEFHKLSEFIYSPHRFGLLFQGHMGQLYLNVGYAQWLVLVLAIYFLIKKKVSKKNKPLLFFSIISFAILFFMMQGISLPVWNIFTFLKNIQFSWRLMIEVMLFTSLMAGVVAKSIKSTGILFLLCSFAILYTILNWGNRKTEPLINDQVLRQQAVFTDNNSVELTTPIWVNINFNKHYVLPKGHVEILTGKGEIKSLYRRQTSHAYLADIKEPSLIKENTFYYPGWTITVNGKKITPDYTNPKYPGVILFRLNPGIYRIGVNFQDTEDRTFAKQISTISSFLFVLVCFALYYFKTHRS